MSIANALATTICEFAASQLRGVMLASRPEFEEGYLGDEDMIALLKRLNGVGKEIPSAFDAAVKDFLCWE